MSCRARQSPALACGTSSSAISKIEKLDIAQGRSQQGRRGFLRGVCPAAMSKRVNVSLRASKTRQNLTKQISIFIEFNIEYSFVNLVFC